MRKLLIGLAASAAFVSPAHAGVVFFDNFNAENGGNSALNYGGFANFDVEGGTVDIVKSGDFDIACPSGGSCVDLDGSTGNGATLVTKNAFSFNAGDTVRLDFDFTGNQRNGADDVLEFGFRSTAGNFLFSNIFVGITPDSLSFGDITGVGLGFAISPIPTDFPVRNVFVEFSASTAGSMKAYAGTTSADNIGPVIDNFRVSVNPAVPEPATWAMMLLGFGAVGSAMRRRSRPIAKVSYA